MFAFPDSFWPPPPMFNPPIHLPLTYWFSQGSRCSTVSFHNFKSQNFKWSVSNPTRKYVAYLSVLSRISNCQGLGRKNKHEILKTDRIGFLRDQDALTFRGLSAIRTISGELNDLYIYIYIYHVDNLRIELPGTPTPLLLLLLLLLITNYYY